MKGLCISRPEQQSEVKWKTRARADVWILIPILEVENIYQYSDFL